MMLIRHAMPDDMPAILDLNEHFVAVLSPLDPERLARLHGQAAQHLVAEIDGQVRAFLLTLREGADYGSPNYRWFAARYPRFLYVDRIVVADQAHGRGLGRALYRQAHAHARQHDVPVLACEFDVVPPNPASARFHAGLGFVEVGRQELGGGKQVSLQTLDVLKDTPLAG
jgi:predicted GNAT superfamily acetyltransferase